MARVRTMVAAMAMVAISGSVGVSGTAQAAAHSKGAVRDCAPNSERVWVYEYPNYNQNYGWTWYTCHNSSLLGHRFRYGNNHLVNDNIDSIYNATQCWATLYQDESRTGARSTIFENSGAADLAGYAVGRNRASSIWIGC